MGSQHQTTFAPDLSTALNNLGNFAKTRSAPILVIRVNLPDIFSGLRTSINLINSSASRDGPHLIPIGFAIPRIYST